MLNDKLKTIETIIGATGTIIGATETLVNATKDLAKKPPVAKDISYVSSQVVEKLSNTPGMTQSRGTKFKKATPNFKLKDGTIIKTYRNSAGVNYVFLANANEEMIFGGYVGWIHSDSLKATIAGIKTAFAASETDTTQAATQTTAKTLNLWHLLRKD